VLMRRRQTVVETPSQTFQLFLLVKITPLVLLSTRHAGKGGTRCLLCARGESVLGTLVGVHEAKHALSV
jgi:hypothetical protein